MTKKYFILMMTVLLSLTASADKWQGTVDLLLTAPNGYTTNIVQAVAIFDNEAGTATLGNGYNACISQFEEGKLRIPGMYSNNNGAFRVEIAPFAFRFCNYLTEVEISESENNGGMTTIGTCAFVGCSRLHTLTLPSSLTTIGAGAFAELPSLKVVYCNAATAPTWEWNDVFATLGTKASMAAMAADRFLYVPAGALASYDSYQFDGTQTRANEKVGWPDAFARVYEVNDEPQPISSLDELVEFRNAVNEGGKYKGSNSAILTADIDMASITNWEPIGTTTAADKRYTGTFNGDGHVIKNLSVDRPNDQYAGLFGYVYNATICNLHLVNPTVKGHNSAGTVVAYADKSHIADVLVDGASVQANGGDGGGIVGSLNVSTAERCLFSGEVTGEGISNCGGIAGSFGYQSATIDCSASGSITNNLNTGGIVGEGHSGVTITRCMARNTITGSGSGTKGAIIGHLYNRGGDSHITDCAYWNQQETLDMIDEQTSYDDTYTVTEEGNKAFYEESHILSDKARNQLGDGWHYFTGFLTGYPIPATLLDMYMNSMLSTDDDGLVYCPLGTPSDFQEYMVYGYKGTAESLTIPATHNGKAVVAINDDVFRGNTTIKTMNTGENMVLIGKGAFYGSAIQDLTLGNNLGEIGESAFEECDALTAVALPTNFQKVGARAFCGCDQLESFSIGYAFKDHTGNFLANCHNLKSLTISGNTGYNTNGYVCEDNVLIHNHSDNKTSYFVACAPGKTGNYTLPTFSGYNRINILGECFEGCTGLTGITFPADHTYWVGGRAFSGATNLRYIDMSGVAGIREGETSTAVTYNVDRQNTEDPFYGTSNATFIYLPDGHSAQADEPNVVIGGTANSILLTDGWDFCPPVDITATNGVGYDRVLSATRTEITQPTGNKITLKDENDQDVEVDELEVTGYTYAPRGYSVCLPYDLTLTAENAKVFVPSAITEGDDWRVSFTEVTDKKMDAYKPYYIVVSGEEEVNLSATGSTSIPSAITAACTQAVGSTDFEFKGTTKAISNANLYNVDKPAYILQSDGNWHKVPANTEDAYVPPFRAYLQASNAKTANQLITMLNAIDLSDVLDNSTVLAKYAGQTVSVTLHDRTLYKDGDWNTLCLPFDVTDGNTEDEVSFTGTPLEGATVMTFNGETSSFNASTGLLTLNFDNVAQNNTIAAGTPFIVKWTGTDVTNPVFSDVTISSTAAGSVLSKDKNVRFLGTYSPVVIYSDAHDNLYLGAANTLYWPSTEGYTMGSCRAYFHVDVNGGAAAVRQFVLNFGDEETGITTTNYTNFTNSDDAWYDLSGRRLSGKPSRVGVYICNGKKVVIKK